MEDVNHTVEVNSTRISNDACQERYRQLDEATASQPASETANKGSKYLENIRISESGTRLSLSQKEGKEDELLSESTTVVRFSPIWKQTLAVSAGILLTFTSGLTSGYSAVLLPQLELPGSLIPSDETTASWIAAIAALPMAPGCLVAGWMMERFGRKASLYIISAPNVAGWVLITFSNSLTLMLIGRFLTGFCVGLLGPLVPVYIGETTDPKYRGLFLASVSLAIAGGLLGAHILGTFLSWQWTAGICTLFPIFAVLLLNFIPESPLWLISKSKIEDGIKGFYWLRGYSDDAKIELKALLEKQKAVEAEPKQNWKEKLTYLKSSELLKPLSVMILFFVTCQFSGVNAIAFYSVSIVEKAVGQGINRYLAMLVIDTIRVVMSVVACIICKRYGRRPLCFISGFLTAVSLVGLAAFLHFTEGKATNMSWIPLLCLSSYITAISIGLVPIPWIMCGEVFPTKVRGFGSGMSSASTFIAFFFVVKTAPGMMRDFGEVMTFLSYGMVALVGTVILYFILPETKGKSLQEIEEKFKRKPKSNSAA